MMLTCMMMYDDALYHVDVYASSSVALDRPVESVLGRRFNQVKDRQTKFFEFIANPGKTQF